MSKRNTPQRRHNILALLQEQGEVSVDKLAKRFETSEVTIRKDLAALETYGLLLRRSEEHTSELQSLMRISYALFCLTKKNILHTPSHKFNNAISCCAPDSTDMKARHYTLTRSR